MSFLNPTFVEIFAHAVVNDKLGSPMFKRYVDSLPFKGNEKMLDLGAGSGVVSKHIARRLLTGGGKLTCLDISEAWLNIARKKMKYYSNVEYEVADIFSTKLQSESLDAVFIHFMLHDIEKGLRPDTIQAVSQKLKVNGRIFIKEPIKESHGMPPEEIRQLMKDAGLKEITYSISKSFIPGPAYTGLFEKQKFTVLQ